MRLLLHLRFILLCLSEASKPIKSLMFQVPNPIRPRRSKVDVPCSARGRSPCRLNHDWSRGDDALKFTAAAGQPRAETTGVSLITVSKWKRIKSPGNRSVRSSRGVGRSFILLNGVSPADETHFTSFRSLSTTTSSILSSHATISTPNFTQPVSTLTSLPISLSTCMHPTPFTETPETLVTTSATPPSTSPIVSGWGLSSSTSIDADRSATFFTPPQSSVTAITLSTVPPRPSPSFTMSDPDTITLAPVYPTSSVVDSTNQPDTTSTSSSPFVIPAPTFLSSIFLSPIPSTSDFPTPIASPYPSTSAISLSSISADDPTVAATSTSVGDQTSTVSSMVETGVLSTDTPHNTGFAHQTGAIIGVAFAGTFVLLLMILLIFFAYKRHRSNRSYNSSMEDILAVSRTSWRPPLEGDDEHYLAAYGHSQSYPQTSATQGEGGFFGDHSSIKGSGGDSAESADPDGPMKTTFGGQPLMPLIAHGSTYSRDPLTFPSYPYNGHGDSRPWWDTTEPLNINKRNNSQQLPLTVDSHVSAVRSRSTSSLGFDSGPSSNGYHGPGSSGEALLPSGSTRRTSIIGPRPIHELSGRRHYSTPPTAFVFAGDSSLEYGAQRIRQQQEEQKKQERADKSISQIIMARLHASRRLSTATTVETYTTIRSDESAPSRAPSYIFSPSLLNPPISMPQTVPRLHLPRGVTGSSYNPDNTLNQHLHRRQRVSDTSEGPQWPDVTLPSAPSPVPTDTSSMVEGLLHPRLGMALAPSQGASVMSLRDHEDYTRPINGLVNNHIRSTTTLQTQEAVDFGE